MVGIPARSTLVEVKADTQDFVPYGTPCSERFDPATQQLEILKCEVEGLQKRLAALDGAKAQRPTEAKVRKKRA
jgi:serine O-acetyltransferase